MKQLGIQFMGKSIFAFLAITSTLFASVEINSIDIFANKIFVNQKIDTSKNSVELLGQVRLEDIRFNLNPNCEVNSTELNNEKFENDELSLKIEELQKKLNINQNEIKSLKSNIAFLERTSLTNISNERSLENTSSFIKKEIMNNYNLIFELEKYLRKKNDELNKLIKKRSNTKFSKLDYSITCNNLKEINISYPIYNIQRNGFYEINYDSLKQNINIKNLSFITQSTGVDFKNIDINLYTYNYTNQLMPNTFRPQYLDIYQVRPVAYEASVMMDKVSMKKSVKRNVQKKTSQKQNVRL